MSTLGGPKVINEGMGLMLDPTNNKITAAAKNTNLLDYGTWVPGNTSATGFSRNGGSDENMLLEGIGPFGENAVVWETRSSGNSGGDGGWNSNYVSADNTKTYRVCVWMKRTTATASGTFYLGTNGGGEAVYRMSNGTQNTNPYWECLGVGSYTPNVWYLVVGHVHPYGTPNGTSHPDTGVYTIADGKVRAIHGCNVGVDCKMGAGTTSIRHRTYHYYSSRNDVRLQFAYPRIDLVDGTEPSIGELLGGDTRKLVNPVNRLQSFFMRNNLRVKALKFFGRGRSINTFDFDGTNDIIETQGGDHTSLKRTVEIVFKVNGVNATYMPIAAYTRGGQQSPVSGKRVWLGVQSGRFRMHGWGTTDPNSTTNITNGDYYHAVYSYDQTTKRHQMWINGVLERNELNNQGGQTGWANSSDHKWFVGGDPDGKQWTSSASTNFDGEIAIFRTYNRILSPIEVKINYGSLRRKYDLG
jgi:hypothetical protein